MNMKNNSGAWLAFVAALISGVSVFFNKFALGFWQSSSVFTIAKNLVAVLLLSSLFLVFKNRREFKKLSKKQWLGLVLIGLIGGSVPFILFFKGLTTASAVNAAFIHKTLFIWVAFMAVPFLKEKISMLQWVAIAALFLGVYLFLSPGDFKIGVGEFFIFLATLMWAVENIIAKKILGNMTSLMAGWGRMFFGSAFLFIFLLMTGNVGSLVTYDLVVMSWLVFSGFLLFGYVFTWYAALKRVSVMVASSVLVLAAPITALLNSIFITHQLKTDLILPFVLIASGILIINKTNERFRIFRQVRVTA